ncbi:MAG TPA: DCC1-like thiol-disulfide oxidoreductase family protein [Bacteroidia bacterium]|nr:DCC1-like thiol-disulfide oxidoreductase family protein [Bacteroidia bacterium]
MPGIPFENHGIILFDGACNYCSRWVDLIMKFDKKDYFRFAALQSDTAQKFLNQKNNSSQQLPDSVILIENARPGSAGGNMFFKSDAGLRIMRKLGFPHSLLFGLIIFPKFIRDAVYNFIADHRYKWFGKREICRVPVTEEEKRKFIS